MADGDKPKPAATPAKSAKSAKSAPAKPAPAVKADQPTKPHVVQPMPPPWWKRLRADPPYGIGLALGASLVGLIILVWWFLTHGAATEAIISPSKLPGPGAVVASWSQLAEQNLGDSVVATLLRVFEGVGLASLVGITLGVLAGSMRAVAAAVNPIVIFLRSIPMGALLPLMVAAFSVGEEQKVMFIFFAIVPFVFSDSVKAISIVPERYVETAQTLGASNRQILVKVLLPLALPDIITSLRFQFGLALGYVMLAEALNAPTGLGHLLNINETRGFIEQNYLLLFVIVVIAFCIDLLIRTLQRGLFRWRSDL